MKNIIVGPAKVRKLRAGHPWLYTELNEKPGTLLRIATKKDEFVGYAIAETQGPSARMLTLRDESIDAKFWNRMISQALDFRAHYFREVAATNAYRLIHGENDFLPGLVVDRYGEHAVLKMDGMAMHSHRHEWLPPLQEKLKTIGVAHLHERFRDKEEIRTLFGSLTDPTVVVEEHGMKLRVNLEMGQKTGLFLDQRESRRFLKSKAGGKRVLNLYSYNGGFSVAAGMGKAAKVVSVDISKGAIADANENWNLNDLAKERHVGITSDVVEWMKGNKDRFGIVVSDPPNFAPRASVKENALRAYVNLHQSCLKIVKPGGYYLAASCSSHVTRSDFVETLAEGASKTRRQVQRLDEWSSPPDHPRRVGFPEGEYLKVIWMRVL